MAAGSGGTSWVPSLPPPRPKSPPQYPDLYGKRRELAKVQMLEREIGFLQEEIKFVEGVPPASRSCKQVADFVVTNSDPLILRTKKKRRYCRFWKWLCRMSCFNFSWICCCKCSTPHLKMPQCCHCNFCTCQSCCDCSIPECHCCFWPQCHCCSWPHCHCCSWPHCKCLENCKCLKKCKCGLICCIPKCLSCSDCSCNRCTFSCPRHPKVKCSCCCTKNCCYPCYFCY